MLVTTLQLLLGLEEEHTFPIVPLVIFLVRKEKMTEKEAMVILGGLYGYKDNHSIEIPILSEEAALITEWLGEVGPFESKFNGNMAINILRVATELGEHIDDVHDYIRECNPDHVDDITVTSVEMAVRILVMNSELGLDNIVNLLRWYKPNNDVSTGRYDVEFVSGQRLTTTVNDSTAYWIKHSKDVLSVILHTDEKD